MKRTSLDPHNGHGFSGSAFSKPQSGQVRRGDKVLIVASRSTVPRDTRYALFVLFAINALNFFDRQVLSAVGEPARRELGLGDAQLGALQTAFTLLYATVGIPFGRLADTRSRTRILAAGCLAWSVLTAACGLAQGFWGLFVLRLLVGVGEASCAPAANALIGDLVPRERRARALSIFMLGLPLGLAASYALSGAIAASYGWRAAFLVAGPPGLVAAIAVLFVREPARSVPTETGNAEGWREACGALLRIPTFRWLVVSGAIHNFNMYAISGFLAPLLMRYHGVSVRDAGFLATVVYGVAGALGLHAGGALSDRASRARPDGRLLATGGAVLLAVPVACLALARERGDWAGFAAAMSVAVLLMYVYYGSIYAALQDAVPARLKGTALGLYFFAMYTLGASFGPLFTGALSDALTARAARAAGSVSLEAFRANGLHDALVIVPVLAAILAAVLFAAARSARRTEPA